MTDAQTYAELAGVFREVFDDDALAIGPDTTADDIPGWDSQANITLFVATEQHFGISFRTAEIESLRNVQEMVHLIVAKRATNGQRP